MSDSVLMPALGESVTEGTVTRWLKNIGDTVAMDEPLLEVSTDKVDTEIPSPFAGTLVAILVGEDETVAVGTALATIGADGTATAPEPAAEPAPAAAAEPDPVAQASPEPEPAPAALASPEPAPQAEPVAAAAPADGGPSEDVTMPALGESVTEGTVTRWLKNVGDTVAMDEPLLEVSTDKVDTEIPSPFAGTLIEVLVGEDETVAVGTPLARIGKAGATAAAAAPLAAPPAAVAPAATAPEPVAPAPTPEPVVAPAAPAPAAPAPSAPAPAAPAPAAPAPAAGGGYLTPLVRKLAADKGVDLAAVTGTGVGGRIRKEDVIDAAEAAERARADAAAAAAATAAAATAAPAPAAPPASAALRPAAPAAVSPLRGTTEKASRLRQVIASRMVESLHSMAQLTSVVEVDVTKVARLRARAKADFAAREGVNLTYLPFFVLAATEALKAHPKINGILDGNQITYHGEENVGIAVDTDRGLVVPVIRGAGDLNLGGIARKIADLAARTRENKVTPDELSGGTFTVTNTGSGGALFDTPIVPAGTSAILGTGAIVKRPVVAVDPMGGEYIAVRSMCYLALSYDHRLVDGADASRYLMSIKKRIEDGDFEAEVGL